MDDALDYKSANFISSSTQTQLNPIHVPLHWVSIRCVAEMVLFYFVSFGIDNTASSTTSLRDSDSMFPMFSPKSFCKFLTNFFALLKTSLL